MKPQSFYHQSECVTQLKVEMVRNGFYIPIPIPKHPQQNNKVCKQSTVAQQKNSSTENWTPVVEKTF